MQMSDCQISTELRSNVMGGNFSLGYRSGDKAKIWRDTTRIPNTCFGPGCWYRRKGHPCWLTRYTWQGSHLEGHSGRFSWHSVLLNWCLDNGTHLFMCQDLSQHAHALASPCLLSSFLFFLLFSLPSLPLCPSFLCLNNFSVAVTKHYGQGHLQSREFIGSLLFRG